MQLFQKFLRVPHTPVSACGVFAWAYRVLPYSWFWLSIPGTYFGADSSIFFANKINPPQITTAPTSTSAITRATCRPKNNHTNSPTLTIHIFVFRVIDQSPLYFGADLSISFATQYKAAEITHTAISTSAITRPKPPSIQNHTNWMMQAPMIR